MRRWPSAQSVDSLLIGNQGIEQPFLDGAVNRYFFFGIIGLTSLIDVAPYGTREFGYFERVSPAPSNESISNAIPDAQFANTLVRYAPYVSYELAVAADLGLESARTLALRIINALRVKTRVDLLVPAFLTLSWSELHRALPGSCGGEILEDIPAAIKLERDRTVEQVDFDWLWASGEAFEELLDDPRFSLAVESLCYCHLLRDSRMMAAGLWAGIEALCGVKQELNFRIALYAAVVLEPRGARRRALFKRVSELYGVRSKAIHGEKLDPTLLKEHVVEVRIMLAQLIVKTIATRKVYEKEDFEQLLFI
jgi:hypothetical protein